MITVNEAGPTLGRGHASERVDPEDVRAGAYHAEKGELARSLANVALAPGEIGRELRADPPIPGRLLAGRDGYPSSDSAAAGAEDQLAGVSSFLSSPDWCISVRMSLPPTNFPSMYTCGMVGQFE